MIVHCRSDVDIGIAVALQSLLAIDFTGLLAYTLGCATSGWHSAQQLSNDDSLPPICTVRHSAKWQNFVSMLFFGTKIPTTKHEIALHAMSLKGRSSTSTNCVRVSWQLGTNWISTLLIRQSGSGARVFVRVLKRKADTLNRNWASSLECYCCLQQHSPPDISAKFYQFLSICSKAIW